jgi:putative DNA methylase
MPYKKKLIEIALPLEAINVESAREKSIRHGHPSTLHLWWARRPLASCRAVLFASMVDDPSAHPDRFPTEVEQQKERQRLHDLIARFEIVNGKEEVRGLVSWEDIKKTDIVDRAHQEIARCLAWDRGEEPPVEPAAVSKYLRKYAPPVYDPFCGGGSIPLEAQRLGLEAYGSDLNPVAVLITKALIEIPPKFANRSPVSEFRALAPNAEVSSTKECDKTEGKSKGKKKTGSDNLSLELGNQYSGARGLAADVRYYGQWMRDEAEKRIGYLYPDAPSSSLTANNEGNSSGKVIAWLWARTVKCANPACGCQMPLIRSFELSTKKGKAAWVEPVIDRTQNPPTIDFVAKTGEGKAPEPPKTGRGVKFNCLACGQPADEKYIKAEGVAGRMDAQLMAIVAEGKKGRLYLSPDMEHEEIAAAARPTWQPENLLPQNNTRDFRTQNYGMRTQGDLYTPRQLVALTTFSDLVGEARAKVLTDAIVGGMADDGLSLNDGGTGATAYADAVATYLAFGVDRLSDYSSTICTWHSGKDLIRNTFGRQAIPMTWDYAEVNPLSDSSGNFSGAIEWIVKVIEHLQCNAPGHVQQMDATTSDLYGKSIVVSTDPPYYDNIGYADLSDYFYVWLRRSLGSVYPNICGTLATPKREELVATPSRFGGSKEKAKRFFEEGLGQSFARMRKMAHDGYPLTVYYAFKQTESEVDAPNSPPAPNSGGAGVKRDDSSGGKASSGWETMLAGLIKAGFSINGTLPMRTELSNRMVASGTNALASSIALICRPRAENAPSATRRQFLKELQQELPLAITDLQRSNIAPVDLAQASIGPGISVFSRYSAVVEADGTPMHVRTALQLINQYLDEYLSEQEGAFDADTRWALAWFEQQQYETGIYGNAETLSRAKNTSVAGLEATGILKAKSGKVQLLKRKEMFALDESKLIKSESNLWYWTQYLIHTLETQGEMGAAKALIELGDVDEGAKDLAYRLYTICDRQGWTSEAIAYNSLVISWTEIMSLRSSLSAKSVQKQQELSLV